VLVNSLGKVQSLYDQNLFVEAFRQSSEYWKPTIDIQKLSIEELILGSRLAWRLGGPRLSRALLRVALKNDPSNPRVRYHSSHIRKSGWRLLDELRQVEAQPDLGGDDPDVRAWWYAMYACGWGALRDFDRAYEYIERAHGLVANDSWILSCESTVLGYADRWEEALASAELAWRFSPGAPFAARSLAAGLLSLGRVDESANRLATCAEEAQSFEVAELACWHLCTLAETLDEDQRQPVLSRARRLTERLPNLAPLVDRETRARFARIHLDIADLADDHAEIEIWAEKVGSPFHRRVLANLRNNPSRARIRLPFRHAIQKHDACLPTSLASALGAMGISISPDSMAAEITFGGTAEWAAAEWLERMGLVVRFFIVTPEIASQLIKHGIAFTMTAVNDDSAHAVAIVGLDEAEGTLMVHDPRSFRIGAYMLDKINCGEAPFGPTGMAVVPRDRTADLEKILPEDAAVASAVQAYHKAITLSGPPAAVPILSELARSFPSHPQTRLLLAVQAGNDGRMTEAFAGLTDLLQEFPDSPNLRIRLVDACRSLRNTALLKQTLKSVVDTGVLPGTQSEQPWVYPPARYVSAYADLLRSSAATREHARSLLYSVLRRQPYSAEAWHTLADLLHDQGDTQGALLGYRLASCLANSNEHYARRYCDALVHAGREEEGLKWLGRRARTYGAVQYAVATWRSWIHALEDLGHPEEALAACCEALQQHGRSPELLGFAVPFLARMGRWEEAQERLQLLQAAGNLSMFHEAAVHFHRMRGDLEIALEHGEAWVTDARRSMEARYVLLDILASYQGAAAALARAALWKAENAGHEGFEELYCQQVFASEAPVSRKYSVLLRRVKRNAEDAWAWQGLALQRIHDYSLADERERSRLESRIVTFLAHCDRTAPGQASTLRAHAEWYEVRGLWPEAVEEWLRAIPQAPGDFCGYQRAWDCCGAFDRDQRQAAWERMETSLLSQPGPLSNAREMMALLAQRFGVTAAEETISRWKEKRGEEPQVLEAYADLLLEHGHGRSDSTRALETLKEAVDRFPYHLGLRFSLANAYRRLGKDAEAEKVLHEIVRRHPGNSAARIQLAWIDQHAGKVAEASESLALLVARDPCNPNIWEARAAMLVRAGSLTEAVSVIDEGLQALPRFINWRSRAISLLIECGAHEQAVGVAREGVRLFPRGAYLWLLLGRTLNQQRRFAAVGEIELCFRRSISFNLTLFESTDWLTTLLVEQRRFDEAEQALRRVEPLLADPSPARGRLAWIKREQGHNRDALQLMASAVQVTPSYRWGWGVLIDWLMEDKAWDRARDLLGAVPPELRTDVSFCVRRLVLLSRAGVPVDTLDVEWDALLKDFPLDVSLHLQRYDALRATHRLPESAAVLPAISAAYPSDPFVTARLPEMLVADGNKERALDASLRVWFAPVEESPWPADKVWETAKTAGLSSELCRKAGLRLQAGEKPTPQAIALMASHAIESESRTQYKIQPWSRTLFPTGGARQVMRMLTAVEQADWRGDVYFGKLFKALGDHGYQRLVVRYWRRHRQLVDVGIDPWAETGRALMALKQKREVRRHLADWRSRAGVRMWAITNYALSFSGIRRAQLLEIRATCGDALAALPHDHCASLLVHLKAEADALLDDRESFVKTWKTYENYFDTSLKEGEFFPADQRHLLGDIPTMARLLEQNETRLYRAAVRRLRWKRILLTCLPKDLAVPLSETPQWVWWLILLSLLLFFTQALNVLRE